MALVTLQEVKNYLKLQSGTAEDSMLTHLISAAQSEMEVRRNRKIEYGVYVETFNGNCNDLFLLAFPIQSVISIKESGVTVSADSYKVDKRTGRIEGCFGGGLGSIEVEYAGGYWTDTQNAPPAGVQALPADIKQDCLEYVAYLYNDRSGRRD